MSTDEPISSEPIRGHVCPACAHGDSIALETSIRPLDTSDVAAAWLFGFWGFLVAITGRTTKRLRCGRCNCRFPRPSNFLANGFLWLILTATATLLMVAVAAWSGVAGSGTSALLGLVADWCRAGASHPAVALAVVGTPAIIVVATYIGCSFERQAARRHLWNAIAKRDASES